MISMLLKGHERGVELAASRVGRIALSVLFVVAISAYFVPLWRASSQFASLQSGIFERLADARWSEATAVEDSDGEAVVQARVDPNAAGLDLVERGAVVVNGRTFVDERIPPVVRDFFDESGRLTAARDIASLLLQGEGARWAPRVLLDRPGLVAMIWIIALAWVLGLIWTGLGWHLCLALVATTVASAPFLIGSIRMLTGLGDAESAVRAVMSGGAVDLERLLCIWGIPVLALTFALITRLLLIALDRQQPVFAIAYSVVLEGSRQRISTAFIAVLVILLPLLPLFIDAAGPLRYQVQTFLSRGMGWTTIIASFLTLVLGCASVAFEIRDRQIWQLMTKPVSRLQYLIGKWIGIISINGALVTTAGLGIFLFVQLIASRPSVDQADALAVRGEVLIGRAGTFVDFDSIEREALRAAIDERIELDADIRRELDDGRAMQSVRAELARELTREFNQAQRTVPPGERKVYTFSGLDAAMQKGVPLRLRYLFHCGVSSTHEVHPVVFTFPLGESFIDRDYVPTQGAFLPIGADLIEDDGTLRIGILNAGFDDTTGQFFPARYSLNFDADDFEILYAVSEFEPNLVRALFVVWTKLAFLGMLAVGCAAFLSFPVACMLSFVVFTIGSMAPFIGLSLEQYQVAGEYRVDQHVIKWIASGAFSLLKHFGSVRPTELLVEGRLIPWREVMVEFGIIGIGWSAVALLLGFGAFQRKELAIYSGNG